MENPIIRIHDLATNQIIDREMTDEELSQHNLDRESVQNQMNAQADKLAAKEAVLAKLGLTAEEAEALLG